MTADPLGEAVPESMSTVFRDFLLDRARTHDDVYYVIADGSLAGVNDAFRAEFPQRFVNTGIAEQNAVSIAGGLALSGYVVYLWNVTTFLLYRPFDQIRLDAAYANLKLRLIGSSAGYTRSVSGIAHISIEDIAVARALPNMTVVCPGDLTETRALLEQCHDIEGPVYMRFGLERDELPELYPDHPVHLGKARALTGGDRGALLCTGHVLPEAAAWVEAWAADGFDVRLVSMPSIKPFDADAVAALVDEGLPIVTYEEHSIIGGLGSVVAEVIAETGRGVPFLRVGVPDTYTYTVGRAPYLRAALGIPGEEEVRAWFEAASNARDATASARFSPH